MSSWVKFAIVLLSAMLTACGDKTATSSATTQAYGFGTPVTENEIAAWNIDVGPDGVGLPAGSATSKQGEPIYLAKCAACHGEFGEGMGRFPAFVGSRDSLTTDRPSKTVGSYWPYATTLWDYINRAMPFGNAQSLTPDEVYGVTAYILAMNDIISEDTVLNAETLPQVKMPNRDGFVMAKGTDIKVEQACMKDCKDKVKVVSHASKNAVKDAKE